MIIIVISAVVMNIISVSSWGKLSIPSASKIESLLYVQSTVLFTFILRILSV